MTTEVSNIKINFFIYNLMINHHVASHPFSWEIPLEIAQMEIELIKNSEIVKKSEFFLCPVARFCSLLFCVARLV
jgi:hypothetical protein